MNFWKTFFAVLLAFVVINLIGFLLLIGFAVSLGSSPSVTVADNSVLHLKINGPVSEMEPENPFKDFGFEEEFPATGLKELKDALQIAKTDSRISGILLESSMPLTSPAMIEEIREALADFKASGKWIYAYSDSYTETGYFLATIADKVFINPYGDLEFNGMTISISFYKNMLEKLEIKPEVFRVGDFKSAVEPFTREDMSPENRLQLKVLVDDLYEGMLTDMATARKLPKAQLKDLADNLKVRTAKLAREYGLVDSLLYEDELHKFLAQQLKLDSGKVPNLVSLSKYQKASVGMQASSSAKDEIAVIVGEGAILPGDGTDQGTLYADRFISELRKAVKKSSVKAIVLRINSPGGEFKSSDKMWREIQLARQVKPVVASMSEYAASGGYYMAMGCDKIVARRSTITGSIGIFGMMFDASKLMENKLGITSDEVRTGNYGELFDFSRPLTEGERVYWQTTLNELYQTFITKAAEGRKMPVDSIARIASGRVWSGRQGLANRLVDREGGLSVALAEAAAAAGISEYKVRYMNRSESFWSSFLNKQSEASAAQIRKELGPLYPMYSEAKRLSRYQGVQARMPFEFGFH